jgi:hypothetical protein
MFLTQYTHRLPADYDMGLIRKRAAERGPYWDRYPGLIFKGFLVQEMGRSSANAYSSLYLWRDAEAFTAMVTGERFQAVMDAFGRPVVETFAVLAFAKGPALSARFVRRVDELVPRQAVCKGWERPRRKRRYNRPAPAALLRPLRRSMSQTGVSPALMAIG